MVAHAPEQAHRVCHPARHRPKLHEWDRKAKVLKCIFFVNLQYIFCQPSVYLLSTFSISFVNLPYTFCFSL
jgi:hypothetical protein